MWIRIFLISLIFPSVYHEQYPLNEHLAMPLILEVDIISTAKSLHSCPTLCDPIDGSPPGSPVPGILQARTLEWAAIFFSNAGKWSRSVVSDPQRPQGLQPSRLLCSWDFPGKSTGVGCHCLLRVHVQRVVKILHLDEQRNIRVFTPIFFLLHFNFALVQKNVYRTCK